MDKGTGLPVQGTPTRSDDYLLGQLVAKVDDSHAMLHRLERDMRSYCEKLEGRQEQQETKIDSLLTWRARVRGAFAVLVGLPALSWGIIKTFGIKFGGGM